MRAKSIVGAIGGLALVGILVGCSGSSSIAPSAAPSTAPTPSARSTEPAASKDVLFTIAANVRDKTGNTIAIQLTAHKALSYVDSAAKPLITEFTKVCAATAPTQSPITVDGLAARGASFVSIDLTSSVGNKPFAFPISLDIGNAYFGVAATGTGIAPVDPAAPCSSGYLWSTSGTAHVTTEFETLNPGPDLTQWKNALYGFSLPADSKATIEACRITLTPEAQSVVAGTAGWGASTGNGVSCATGYVGE